MIEFNEKDRFNIETVLNHPWTLGEPISKAEDAKKELFMKNSQEKPLS